MEINELCNLCNVESTDILHNEETLSKQDFAFADRLPGLCVG